MAATVVVVLTFVMAWIAQRSAPRFGWLLDALAFTPIAIPSVIVGASILFAYLMLPIPVYNTIWILLIAYVTLYLPYGMRFASSGITQIHRELEEVRRGLRRAHRPDVPARAAAAAAAGPAGGLDLCLRAFGARTRRVDLPGRARHPRARHHQPDHVGGGRQLRRGRGARRHPDPAAARHRRRPALAGDCGCSGTQRGRRREGARRAETMFAIENLRRSSMRPPAPRCARSTASASRSKPAS